MLIDRSNRHLFQPLLYQVATSVLSPGQIGSPIRQILKRQSNTTVALGGAGFKYSGVGREYGRYGIEAFLEPKAILE